MNTVPLHRTTGFSGYPVNSSDWNTPAIWQPAIDDIITALNTYRGTSYRIGFNPIGESGSRPYNLAMVQYFLDNAPDDWIIIVDGNHYFETSPNIPNCITRCLDICSNWPNDPRVWVELFNEPPWGYDQYTNGDTIIAAIRGASYTNTIIQNKFDCNIDTTAPWDTFTDPLDNTYQGFHIYVNQYPPDPGSGSCGKSWNDLMQGALDAGITKLINTEIGAHFGEKGEFTQPLVDDLNDFIDWCYARNIGNQVWLRVGTDNLLGPTGYNALNLSFPP